VKGLKLNLGLDKLCLETGSHPNITDLFEEEEIKIRAEYKDKGF